MKYTEKLHRRRRLYKGRAISFSADVVRLPGGKTSLREYTEHPGAAAVLAVFPGGRKAVFVRQHRWPVRENTLEIPAGKLVRGENPVRCALRELEEETGWRAGRIKKMISYWPAAAFSTEVLHIYLASRLKKGRRRPDSDELVYPEIKNISEVSAAVRRGKIRDAKTIMAVLFYERFLSRRIRSGGVRKVTEKNP